MVEADVSHPQGAAFVRERVAEITRALGCRDARDASAHLRELMLGIGLEMRLRNLGVARSDLDGLVRSVNDERLSNNPRRLPAPAIGRILEAIF